MIHRDDPPVEAGSKNLRTCVPKTHYVETPRAHIANDPSVSVFAALVEARDAGDVKAAKRLLATLRGLGWNIFASEPKGGGRW